LNFDCENRKETEQRGKELDCGYWAGGREKEQRVGIAENAIGGNGKELFPVYILVNERIYVYIRYFRAGK
jgi:hypothetical protein